MQLFEKGRTTFRENSREISFLLFRKSIECDLFSKIIDSIRENYRVAEERIISRNLST